MSFIEISVQFKKYTLGKVYYDTRKEWNEIKSEDCILGVNLVNIDYYIDLHFFIDAILYYTII